MFVAIVATVRDRWVDWTSRLLDEPEAEKPARALLMMGAIDAQVVLFPTDLARGDPAIAGSRRLSANEPTWCTSPSSVARVSRERPTRGPRSRPSRP